MENVGYGAGVTRSFLEADVSHTAFAAAVRPKPELLVDHVRALLVGAPGLVDEGVEVGLVHEVVLVKRFLVRWMPHNFVRGAAERLIDHKGSLDEARNRRKCSDCLSCLNLELR